MTDLAAAITLLIAVIIVTAAAHSRFWAVKIMINLRESNICEDHPPGSPREIQAVEEIDHDRYE